MNIQILNQKDYTRAYSERAGNVPTITVTTNGGFRFNKAASDLVDDRLDGIGIGRTDDGKYVIIRNSDEWKLRHRDGYYYTFNSTSLHREMCRAFDIPRKRQEKSSTHFRLEIIPEMRIKSGIQFYETRLIV